MRKSRFARNMIRAAALSSVASAALHSSFARASDGTWANDAGTTGANWNTASNWFGSSVPNAGGSAFFIELNTFSTGPINVIQDAPTVTVSKIDFNSVVTYLVKSPTAALTNSITLTGAANVNLANVAFNTLSITTFGHQLQIPVAGTAGLNKTGPGTLTLWQTNTYSGGTTINGGVLVARQFGDLCFGSTAAGNDVSINNATVRISTGTGWTTSRKITLAGDGSFECVGGTAFVFNNDVTGSGALSKLGSSGTLILNANSTYSGATNILSGTMNIAASGQALSTASVANRGWLNLTNSTGNLDRLNNAASIASYGGVIALSGAAGVSTTETIGATTMSRGTSQFTVTPGPGMNSTLAMGNVTRANGGGAFFTGPSLGAASVSNTANITFANAPTLTGGSGAAGTPDVSIIPWAYGNTLVTANAATSTNSLVTYGANGVRPLDLTTEYASAINVGATTTNNVRLTASTAIASASTINALVTAGAVQTISGAGPLTVSSGAILNIGTATINTPVDFGSAEAFIQSPGTLTINGAISGSGGLTKHGAGVLALTAANSYTGTTTIGGGTTTFNSAVGSGTNSPLGNSTSAVVLAGGGIGTGGLTPRLTYVGAGTVNFDRPITVTSRMATNNAATLPAIGTGSGAAINFNADITLDGSSLSLLGTGGAANSFIKINGNITGDGAVTDGAFTTSASTITLNGNNTFTGGVEMFAGTWNLGTDTALGTGKLFTVQSSGTGPTIAAVGGTRIVPNDVVPFSNVSAFWTIGGSNDIHFTGDMILAANTYQHNITNTATTYYDGFMHTAGFIKTGTGTLVLTGANNTYNGPTTINVGVLRASSAKALGTVEANTVVAAGATLEVAALTLEPVTVNGTGVGGLGAMRSLSGNSSVATVNVASASTINVDSGKLTTGAVSSLTAATLTKAGNGTLASKNFRALGLNIGSGTVSVLADGSTAATSKITALTIPTSGVLDLNDNDLIVNTGTTTKAQVETFVKNGYNFGGFDGVTSITSSAARNNPTGNTTLGVISGQEYTDNAGAPALFSGQSYAVTDTLVKYTYFGDVDFNGAVDSTDYNIIDFGFLTGRSGWANGDVDYSGAVDSTDYNLIDFAFVTQSGALRRAVAYLDGSDRSTRGMNDASLQEVIKHFDQFGNAYAAGFLAQVPEPTSIGVIGLCIGATMSRRRRAVK